MSILTDIAIEHIYKGKKSTVPLTFTLHPFENAIGVHAGLFEIARTLEVGAKRLKRSAHLTKCELAEMYARNLHEQYDIKLRLRPAGQDYPDAPPGKKVPSRCIASGSDFERMVRAIDLSSAITPGLRDQLRRLGV